MNYVEIPCQGELFTNSPSPPKRFSYAPCACKGYYYQARKDAAPRPVAYKRYAHGPANGSNASASDLEERKLTEPIEDETITMLIISISLTIAPSSVSYLSHLLSACLRPF